MIYFNIIIFISIIILNGLKEFQKIIYPLDNFLIGSCYKYSITALVAFHAMPLCVKANKCHSSYVPCCTLLCVKRAFKFSASISVTVNQHLVYRL